MLRTLPIEAALQFRGAYLAAGQSHGFENPLVPELRFLIRLFPRTSAILYLFVISIRVFLHRTRASSPGCGDSSGNVASLQQDNEERGWDCWFLGQWVTLSSLGCRPSAEITENREPATDSRFLLSPFVYANLGFATRELTANTPAYFPLGSFDKSVILVVTFCPFSMPPMSTRPSCVTSNPR